MSHVLKASAKFVQSVPHEQLRT